MWRTVRNWLIAAVAAAGAMGLLLFAVGLFMDPPGFEEDAVIESAEPAAQAVQENCTFRLSGTVTDRNGDPIESAILELKAAGPFATADRIAVTNYAGRFLYTESGFGTCFLEDLFPTVRSEGYPVWSRQTPVANDEELEIVLSGGGIR
jgi:hypothetical protein